MNKILLYILVMALVTYAVRMIPFLLFRKKIKSRFVRSVLHYIPYAVLSAMVIPDVFFSTGGLDGIIAGVCGFTVAVILAALERSLLTVAVCAVAVAYVVGFFI